MADLPTDTRAASGQPVSPLKRVLPFLLLFLTVAGVGFGLWRSFETQQARAELEAAPKTQSLRGAIGSEKADFLADPEVIKALASHNFVITADRVGSREIATGYEPGAHDFGWPSGAPAAAKLKALTKASGETAPFYTPMVIVTWAPIADILARNGLVTGAGQVRTLDMSKLLDLMQTETRWKDLAGAGAYPVGKQVLVTTTDVRRSNSAAMYLALASYVLNNGEVVDDSATADATARKIAPLFLRQGFQETTSANPFTDFLAMGMGKTPLLFAYESQVVEYLLDPAANRRNDIVILYPAPTILSKHVLVPYTPEARRLAEVLATDPALQAHAERYGFRVSGSNSLPPLWAKAGIKAPPTLLDVIEPPSFEITEAMIGTIEGSAK